MKNLVDLHLIEKRMSSFLKINVIVFVSILLSFATPAVGQPIVGAAFMDEYLPLLEGKNVAFCGNHTSRIQQTLLVDTLLARGCKVVSIFCPEHGFRGEAEAGAHIHSSTDSKTGLPIVSLYGSNKKPMPDQLQGIDVILFDIQDVGCRFYTYISTLHYVMEAAAENNVQVIVLDRPNPNGYFVDGPVLKPAFRSFVGMHCVPVVHGMTIGEYATMVNEEGWLTNSIRCDLHVVKMKNYTHKMRYSLPIPPSPNLQTDESVYLYPSLCLFEGTCISVGRGTMTPFQIFGHPNLQCGDFYFVPTAIKGVSENPPQKNVKCRGFDLTPYAHQMLDSTNSFSIHYLLMAYQHFPDKQKFFISSSFFDKLAGTDVLRKQIEQGVEEKVIRDSWQSDLKKFKSIRRKYLLYPDFE